MGQFEIFRIFFNIKLVLKTKLNIDCLLLATDVK